MKAITRPEALIFDCDGVLVDSELLSNTVDVESLAAVGIRFDLQDYMDRFVGLSWASVMEALGREFPGRLPADFTEQVSARKLAAFRRSLRPVPEVLETLVHPAIASLPRCVASSSSLERLGLALEVTGLASSFGSRVYSAQQVPRGKPAPDLFLLAASQLGVEPAACWVVEDSPSGVKAAVAAGMLPLGFVGGGHCGPRHAESLRAAGARAVLYRFSELPQRISGASADRARDMRSADDEGLLGPEGAWGHGTGCETSRASRVGRKLPQ